MARTSPPPERQFTFDAFLSHNSNDKPTVRSLKQRLQAARLKVWFDEDELRPGIPWLDLLEAGIRLSRSVVIAVGVDGVGPWEDEEMQGALQLAVRDRLPVIPVLMPGALNPPDLPMFLGNRTWVDLRDGITATGLERLMWGITGRRGKVASDLPEMPQPQPQPPPFQPTPQQQWFTPAPQPQAQTQPWPQPQSQPQPQTQTQTQTLNQVLPGHWHVQIQLPYAPNVVGEFRVELLWNGAFNGQLMSPMGAAAVQGQWQANPMLNQIGLQGMQSNGFQIMPYAVLVQVNYFDPQRITGVTSAGEQVSWQRLA